MRLPAILVTWCLSVAPLVLGWGSGGEVVLVGALQGVLTLLPWVALAGLPRGRAGGAGAAAVLGLALPPAALGASLDVGNGADPVHVALGLAAALGLAVLLASAAGRAARAGGRAAVLHAALWLVLVPGAAALAFALEGAALPGGPPPLFLSAPLGVTPLVAAHALARGAATVGEGAGALVLALALFLLAGRGARTAPADEEVVAAGGER